MKNNHICLSALLVMTTFAPMLVMSQNIELAKDLYSHGLSDRALETFITIYHTAGSSANQKAEALYYIGQLSFNRGNYSAAIDTWNKLVTNHSTDIYAVEIKGRLEQLSEVILESSDELVTQATAKSYINNGDFWSDSNRKFTIDSSWLPKVELAIEWYDKVIEQFPSSDASEIAYQRKLFAILGWSETGRYGSSFGIRENSTKYLPLLLSTFSQFEVDHPQSSYLQGFRYQIAQVYWGRKEWDKTRHWLNLIIEKSEGRDTFYSMTARARLNKIEY